MATISLSLKLINFCFPMAIHMGPVHRPAFAIHTGLSLFMKFNNKLYEISGQQISMKV